MTSATTSLTIDDQRIFAQMSGDYNPMHLDELYARRTQAAEPAVHGIHGMLWGLDSAEVSREQLGNGIKVRFENFLYLGQPVKLRRATRGASTALELISGERLVTSIALDVATAVPVVTNCELSQLSKEPLALRFEDIAGRSGAFAICGSDADYAERFPNLATVIGGRRVRAMGGLSTLVGMVVPGLHSIFSKCEIGFVDDGTAGEALSFSVLRTYPVLQAATIVFRGGGIAGRIDAFVRTPPVAQARVTELASRSTKRDFKGRRALVIGGSRGLGELTAKLVALRGGAVTVTYLRGREDADKVASEISVAGHDASARRFDAAAPDVAQLQSSRLTDVFYYATPPIFARRTAGYSADAADRFMAIYCHHFAHLIELLAGTGTKMNVFWPSSTALDEHVTDLAEYSMAKAAGEKLCELLAQRFPNLQILVRRLPRLDTDQTSSAIPVKSESSEQVMSEVLDAMAALRG